MLRQFARELLRLGEIRHLVLGHLSRLALGRTGLGQEIRLLLSLLRHGVLGELLRRGTRIRSECGAREAEVTDLEGAVGVDQDVRWLDVAVDHLSRVDVVDAAEQLEGGSGWCR